ncbi:MAG: phosphodiesterase YaeI [Opitutus sp.]
MTRRQFLLGLAGGLATATTGAAYVSLIEPRWLAVSRIQVPRPPPANSSPIRILQLSDLHLSSVVPLDWIEESVALGLAEKPDVIALTGDFYTGKAQQVDAYAKVLRRLSAAAPTFACLGNHDGGRWSEHRGGLVMIDAVRGMLANAGVTCLVNERRTLEVRGQRLAFFGVGDLWSAMCDPGTAFANAGPRMGEQRIVLSHNPDSKTMFKHFDWDVMLCGHTHGGQVCLPFVGAPFAPVSDKRFLHGLYSWENRWLHVTSGVGNLHGIRFNCRPEISVITLG